MAKATNLNITLFNKNPNTSQYKGRKGWVIKVVHNGDLCDTYERWEWRMRYFSPNDRVNGALERIRMEALISEGWQSVNPTTLGHWEMVEKDGIRFGSEEGFVKLF
jgi:hypothetical protein